MTKLLLRILRSFSTGVLLSLTATGLCADNTVAEIIHSPIKDPKADAEYMGFD